MKQSPRSALLHAQLQQRILVMDGAMGTMIQELKLTEADFRGERFIDHPSDVKGNNELLTLTQPAALKNIHMAYLRAGSDIIETNTFTANRVSQSDYGTEEFSYEINVQAARLARQAADEITAEDPTKPRFVAGAVGPTTRAASLSPKSNPIH